MYHRKFAKIIFNNITPIIRWEEENSNIVVGYLKKEPTFLITKKLDEDYYVLQFSIDKKTELSELGYYSRLRDAKRGAERFIKKIKKLLD